MFCFSLNALLFLVPEYHMMDMNIISLVTISLLMVSMLFFQVVLSIACSCKSALQSSNEPLVGKLIESLDDARGIQPT